MQQVERVRTGPSLVQSLITFVVLTMVVSCISVGAVIWSQSDRVIDGALDQAVRVRTDAAGQELSRAIYGDWRDLSHLAQMASTADGPVIGNLMNGMRGDGSRISWIGYADVEGTVLQASAGLLVGADVSQRPWFRNGMRSGFAGDVHEAVLLAQKLRPEGGEPLRFVDLALPVVSREGDVLGVVGMHIDTAWVAGLLGETARSLGIDLYLLGSDGKVAISSDSGPEAAADPALLRAARTGTASAGRERWPDGHDYFSTFIPELTYRDLPHFGWSLVGRLEASALRPGLAPLRGMALTSALVLLLIVAVMTALYVLVVLRPLGDLARSADRIADGAPEYPPEARGTREASLLSSALVRLQEGFGERPGSDPSAPQRSS